MPVDGVAHSVCIRQGGGLKEGIELYCRSFLDHEQIITIRNVYGKRTIRPELGYVKMKECESKRILTRKQCSMAKCSVLICSNGKCTVRKPLVSALQRAGDPLMETQRWLACLVFIGPVTKFLIPPYQVSFLSYCLMSINLAELMLWKKKRESAVMLAGISGVWLLLEVLDYHFVTLLCYLLIITMLLLFSWNKLALLINWAPPNVHDFEISNATFTRFFDTVNRLVHHFFQVSTGQNFKLFAMVMGSIWLVSLIGELTNSLNLIYIGWYHSLSLPLSIEFLSEKDCDIVVLNIEQCF
ncbi:Reticulon-like protein B9, partial [Cucurbita argyrosperma subsp. argyrosperma]